MRTFNDKTGKEWVIDLPIGEVLRIKAASEFNLLDVTLAAKLWDDDLLFYELLWHVIERQATAQNVDATMFGQNIAAQCLVDAKEAFFEEWEDFFLNLRQPQKAVVVEKALMMHKRALEKTQQMLSSERFAKLDTKIDETISAALNNGCGKLEAELDSILANSLGDNSTP